MKVSEILERYKDQYADLEIYPYYDFGLYELSRYHEQGHLELLINGIDEKISEEILNSEADNWNLFDEVEYHQYIFRGFNFAELYADPENAKILVIMLAKDKMLKDSERFELSDVYAALSSDPLKKRDSILLHDKENSKDIILFDFDKEYFDEYTEKEFMEFIAKGVAKYSDYEYDPDVEMYYCNKNSTSNNKD